jgi:peptidoglycan/xylan/chitin deacetylase (PgdA/CDA1 family)
MRRYNRSTQVRKSKMNDPVIALRMDDVGASSKRYEVYSKVKWRLASRQILSGDWLFLKYLPGFKAWGPYRELTAADWAGILDLLQRKNWKLTVGVTAAWATREHDLAPFPLKFPEEARALREGLEAGLLEIANHGLSHSVLQGSAFRPKWFEGNRKFHREFYDWVAPEVHEDHIRRSQHILQDFFGPVVTFIPPGNVFTEHTAQLAARYGLRYISCNVPAQLDRSPQILGNRHTLAFHDRELVLEGLAYFDRIAAQLEGKRSVFVKDLAASLAGEPA